MSGFKIARPLAATGLALIAGAVAGLAGTMVTQGHLLPGAGESFPTHTGKYAVKEDSCINNESAWINPINVVFYGYDSGADYTRVKEHAAHHGGWTYSHGGTQWFLDHGYCLDQDDQSNSNPPFQPFPYRPPQYHMRYHTGRESPGGPYDYDATWGYFTVATPHHEEAVVPAEECGSSGHAVNDNELEPPGGFNRGRNDIKKNWIDSGAHPSGGAEYWDNRHRFRQSEGSWVDEGGQLEFRCWEAWSDGWVLFVHITIAGDVDCDGDLDAVDALKILRYVAGLEASDDVCAEGKISRRQADVDRNSTIDSFDALYVLQFVAGLRDLNTLSLITPASDGDNDGLTDQEESAYPCLNPEIPDARADPDLDSLSGSVMPAFDNISEVIAGTNPCVPDTDADTFFDSAEFYIGIDPLVSCPDTPDANDEADDKWPPDFNDDQTINILDVVQLTPPVFGSQKGDEYFERRKDLNPDGTINILDIVLVTPPVFGSSCS